jgi:DNA polymerase elongation subunit (family B)
MKLFTDRYKSGVAHIDLMVEFCNYGEYEKLDNLARFILGSQKVEFDYREIPELLKTDEGKAKITEYCLKDCELTYKLAKRMGF